jgi:hypothetical protein
MIDAAGEWRPDGHASNLLFLRLATLAAELTLIALIAARAARIHATPTAPESCYVRLDGGG